MIRDMNESKHISFQMHDILHGMALAGKRAFGVIIDEITRRMPDTVPRYIR